MQAEGDNSGPGIVSSVGELFTNRNIVRKLLGDSTESTPPPEDEAGQSLNADEEMKRAKVEQVKADTTDKKTLTGLKKTYANRVFCFMVVSFGLVAIMVAFYFYSMQQQGEPVPYQVIVAGFTCTTVIVGLVGFMIKGLFQTPEAKGEAGK